VKIDRKDAWKWFSFRLENANYSYGSLQRIFWVGLKYWIRKTYGSNSMGLVGWRVIKWVDEIKFKGRILG
jgi:hypothetical protein